ncbi:MAG: alginate export family protein, partial [Thermodesulfobacteriota bacterium]
MLRTTGVLFKRKVIFLLFLIFFCFMTIPVFADEAEEKGKEKQKEAESEKIVVLRAGEWEIDVGGQVRLRGDFAKNQNFTDLSFTPGHDEAQFLERTRLQASVENHGLNLKAFFQFQWYGRWGGLDNRSAFDLYQGYIEWEKILGSPISLKVGRQEFLYGSAFFIGT